MKLSIITINYNNKEGLEKTIESVMSQTFRDFEWIIIDGGSTDGSKEVLEELANNPNSNISYWCSEPDKGIYNAMNKGIHHAKGEYLNFMNSGDCFYEPVSLQYVFSSKIDDDVIYGQVYFKSTDNQLTYKEYTKNANLESYLNRRFINHQASFIKKKWCDMHPYDETFKISADTEFFMNILTHGAHFTCIDIPLVIYQIGGLSWTNMALCREDEKMAIAQNICNNYMPWGFHKIFYYYRTTKFMHRLIHLIDKCIKLYERII